MPAPKYLKNYLPRTLPPTRVNGIVHLTTASGLYAWDADYAYPWDGKPLLSSRASEYPVLWGPQGPPNNTGFTSRYFEPQLALDGPRGFAKKGTLLRHPRAVVVNTDVGDNLDPAATLAAAGLDTRLSDMGVCVGTPALLSNQDYVRGFPDFLVAAPFHDLVVSTDASVDAEYVAAFGQPSPSGVVPPWKEQYHADAWVGGEVLFVFLTGMGGYPANFGWGQFGPYSSCAPDTTVPQVAGSYVARHQIRTDKRSWDVAKIAAQAPKFARASWRVYYAEDAPGTAVTNTDHADATTYFWQDAQDAVSLARGAGIDITIQPFFGGGPAQVTAMRAQLEADVRTFFGL